ncbi:MAG: hypothetical protein LC749_03075 [Actinobacteria bacterium]|nr:hypothetical protein [Actinomycetota bacterium]
MPVRQFRRVELVLAVPARVVLGALAAILTECGLGAWIAAVTTINAAVTARGGAARYAPTDHIPQHR